MSHFQDKPPPYTTPAPPSTTVGATTVTTVATGNTKVFLASILKKAKAKGEDQGGKPRHHFRGIGELSLRFRVIADSTFCRPPDTNIVRL